MVPNNEHCPAQDPQKIMPFAVVPATLEILPYLIPSILAVL